MRKWGKLKNEADDASLDDAWKEDGCFQDLSRLQEEESFSSFFWRERWKKRGRQSERLLKRETRLIIHKFCQRVSTSPPLWWPGRKEGRCRCRSFRRWCDLLGLQIESALLAWRSFSNNAAFCLQEIKMIRMIIIETKLSIELFHSIFRSLNETIREFEYLKRRKKDNFFYSEEKSKESNFDDGWFGYWLLNLWNDRLEGTRDKFKRNNENHIDTRA